MSDRLFWDVVEGRVPLPPAARLLGTRFVSLDPESGTIETSFEATDQLLNTAGDIQGGMLCSMLDVTLGSCAIAALDEGQWAPTLELHTHFLARAHVGPMVGRARVVKRGGSVVFVSGELVQDDRVVATATASALVRGRHFADPT
jgi:uncharacterized protein (TIGR00369 family)